MMRARMPYSANDDQWPVCVDRMSGQGTDADIRAYNEQRETRLAREQLHVQVIDATRGATLNGDLRRTIADFNAKNSAAQQRWVAGLALIGDSAIVRGILHAIYWVEPPPYPYAIFAERGEALAWALARLQEKREERA